MSGPNQHYIPRFLQRAFGIRPRRLSIWRFRPGEDPECRRIKRTGASDHFYSAPSPGGEPTLDDAITAVEQQIASTLNGIRSGCPGEPVDADAAAKAVSHLATRTAHARSTIADGVARLLERAEGLIAEPANVKALVGLDSDTPNRLLREAISSQLARLPEVGLTGIPSDVLERIGFMLLQEGWGDFAEQFGVLVAGLVDVFRSQADEATRDAHRGALAETTRASGWEATLRTLEWTVEKGPSTGAILPDCVVIAFDEKGNAGNHLLVGADRIYAVVMAVSPKSSCSAGDRRSRFPRLSTTTT